MTKDIPTILLAICLIATIAGIVVIGTIEGGPAIGGTGLGALATVLAGSLAWRVKRINGNGGAK